MLLLSIVLATLGFGPKVPSQCVVTTSSDSAAGRGTSSLRSCITQANQNAGNKDTTITFNLGSSQKASTIVLNSALPTVTADSTVIDTGGAAIVVTGAYFGPRVPSTTVGLTINGTHCVVRGLTITSFPGLGLAVNGKNFIFDGGTVSFCGGGAGIWIFDTANGATIGNTAAPAENRVYVISNTGVGIAVDSPGVTVTNAAIGIGPNGANAGNQGVAGIYIFSSAAGFTLGSDVDGAPLTFLGFNKGNGVEICAPRFSADGFVVGLNFNVLDPAPNTGHAGIYFRTSDATDGKVAMGSAGRRSYVSSNARDGIRTHGPRTSIGAVTIGLGIDGSNRGNGGSGIYVNSTATDVTVGVPLPTSSLRLLSARLRANTIDVATYVCGSGSEGIDVTTGADRFVLGAAYVGIGVGGAVVPNNGGIRIGSFANDARIGVEGLLRSGSGSAPSSSPGVAAFIAGNAYNQVTIDGYRAVVVNVAVGFGPNGYVPCKNETMAKYATFSVGDSADDFDHETGTNSSIGIDGSSSYTFICPCSGANTGLYIESSGVTVANVIVGLGLDFKALIPPPAPDTVTSGHGILVENQAGYNLCQIGGKVSRNYIAGLPSTGIDLRDTAVITNTVVGITPEGNAEPNLNAGIAVHGDGTGALISDGTYVSGNAGDGISLYGPNITIAGDVKIGLGLDGITPLPNGGNGITVHLGADDAVLGSASTVSHLIVAANTQAGILIQGKRARLQNIWVGMNKYGSSIVASSNKKVFGTSSTSSSTASSFSRRDGSTRIRHAFFGDRNAARFHAYGGIVLDESLSDGSTIGGGGAASMVVVGSGAGDGLVISGTNISATNLMIGHCASPVHQDAAMCGNAGHGITLPAGLVPYESGSTPYVVIGSAGATTVHVAGNEGVGIFCNRAGTTLQNVGVGEAQFNASSPTSVPNGGHGVWFGAKATGSSIVNSAVQTSGEYGIYIDGTHVSALGNLVNKNGAGGIFVNGNNATLDNNTVSANNGTGVVVAAASGLLTSNSVGEICTEGQKQLRQQRHSDQPFAICPLTDNKVEGNLRSAVRIDREPSTLPAIQLAGNGVGLGACSDAYPYHCKCIDTTVDCRDVPAVLWPSNSGVCAPNSDNKIYSGLNLGPDFPRSLPTGTTALQLDGTGITSVDWEQLSSIQNSLVALGLSNNPKLDPLPTDGGKFTAGQFPSLTSLSLRGTDLSRVTATTHRMTYKYVVVFQLNMQRLRVVADPLNSIRPGATAVGT
eukprot:gene6383-4074_t